METSKNEKMSYEQLENIAHQLSEQNKQMYEQLQQVNIVNMFKRLDYLFKVVEYQNAFPEQFVTASKQEIMSMMILEEEKNEKAK